VFPLKQLAYSQQPAEITINGKLSDKAYKTILGTSQDVKKKYYDILTFKAKSNYFLLRSQEQYTREVLYFEYKNNMLTNFLEKPSSIILEFSEY